MSSEEIPTPGSAFEEVGGEAAEETVGEAHAAAEGMDPGQPRQPWFVRALRNTDPHPPIEEVGGFQDVRDNWSSYLTRGIQKLGGVDDAEAWVDLVKGLAGLTMERAEVQEDSPDEEAPDGDETARIRQGLNDVER